MVETPFQHKESWSKLVTNLYIWLNFPTVGALVPRHLISAGSAPPLGRTDLVPFIALAIAALAIGFEQIIQWRYGPMGIIAFVALSIGIKAKNATISGLGAVILVMLLAQSG